MSSFISYSSKDIVHVNSLSNLNKGNKKRKQKNLWISFEKNRGKKNIESGDLFREKILKAIKQSSSAVLFISNDFLNSDFILNVELPAIIEKLNTTKGYRIIPVLVDKNIDITEYDVLKNFHFVNSPSTSLNDLSGGAYRLKIQEILEDIPKYINYFKKEYLIYSSIIVLMGFLLRTTFTENKSSPTNESSNQANDVILTTSSTSTTSTTLLEPVAQKLTKEEIQSIEKCIDEVADVNIFMTEYLYFLIEKNPLTQHTGIEQVRLISNDQDIEEYVDSMYGELGIHNFYKGAFGDREHEIESYLLLNTETSQELFNIKYDLENQDYTFITSDQREELNEIVTLFDKSFQKLNWFYKSGEGSEVNPISSEYLEESRVLFLQALYLFLDYKEKYLIEENKYSNAQILKCGEIEQTNYQDKSSEWNQTLTIVPLIQQRNRLLDLDTGDCGFLPEITGFNSEELYFLPQHFMGLGSRFSIAYGKTMGIFKNRFPDFRYVIKNDCNKGHTFEIGPIGTIDTATYNFDWYTGLPETWWELDFSLMVNCMMETTEYLGFPFVYTGYHMVAIIDTTSQRAEERKYMCIYYKYEWDDQLAQIDGYKSLINSIRSITTYQPKIEKSGWLYEKSFNTLQRGECWMDPEPDIFDRALIHNSARDDYRSFTYLGYGNMNVKLVDCNNVHLNQVIHKELLDNSLFNNKSDLKNHIKSVCEEQVLDLIADFRLSDEKLSEYGEQTLTRDRLGLDIFIDSDEINISKNNVICSVYKTVEYSNILHPPGYGDEFLDTVGYSLIPEN